MSSKVTKIQIKRGLEANLPTLSAGEPAFTTDQKNFYIGDGSINQRYLKTTGDTMTGALVITADSTSILNVTKADATSVFNVDTTNAITSAYGRLIVDGSSDVVQSTIQAHSTQTANISEIQLSDTTVTGGWDERGILFSHGGTSASNFFGGSNAGKNTATGGANIAIGSSAGQNLSTGIQNVFLGTFAGYSTNTGSQNFMLGAYAGWQNYSSARNTGIGIAALSTLNRGSGDNIAIGGFSMTSTTTGGFNVAIGFNSLYSNTTANDNTAIGYQSGYSSVTGTRNITLGRYSGYRNISSDRLIVDNQQRADAATELTNSILYGVMNASPSSQTLRVNAATTISQTFEVTGETLFSDKVKFTQTDGNEYIDSLNDGYMDYGATTGHRFNNNITTTGRLILDGDSSMADYANSVHSIIFGDGQDSAIGYDGADTYLVNLVGSGDFNVSMSLKSTGRLSSETMTITTSADNTDVSGINTLWITTAGGAVVLGGLTGGIDGQVLYIVRKDTTNGLTLENAEGAGDQDFIMHQGTDEIIDGGGVVLMCDGSDWYDVSHAKHV